MIDRDYLKIAESEHLIGCSAQILPMKSAYSAIQGFDWVVSRVVRILQIVTICQLKAFNPYCYHFLKIVQKISNF